MKSDAIDPEELVAGLPALVPMVRVAEHCNVTTRTVRNWVAAGRLRTLRTNPSGGGRTLVPRADLARLLASMIEARPSY